MRLARRIEDLPPYLFADRDEVALLGFGGAVRLHEVRWEEEG